MNSWTYYPKLNRIALVSTRHSQHTNTHTPVFMWIKLTATVYGKIFARFYCNVYTTAAIYRRRMGGVVIFGPYVLFILSRSFTKPIKTFDASSSLPCTVRSYLVKLFARRKIPTPQQFFEFQSYAIGVIIKNRTFRFRTTVGVAAATAFRLLRAKPRSNAFITTTTTTNVRLPRTSSDDFLFVSMWKRKKRNKPIRNYSKKKKR